MHQLLEQQLRQWLGSHSPDLPPQLLAAIDETYRQADATKAELETEIQQARELEAVGRVAGGIAHDFNNLLTVIKGYCDLCLRLSEQDDTPVSKGLQQIAQATERAAEMTVQLLALSRRRKPDPTMLDLNTVMRDFHPMLRRLVDEDISLDVVTDAAEATIFADRGHLQQLLLNLVIHVRESTAQGNTITLKTIPWSDRGNLSDSFDDQPISDQSVLLTVAIPTSTKSLRRATGLSVLSHLTEGLGGTLAVSRDQGLVGLVVVLPLHNPTADGKLLKSAVNGTAAPTRILVVEDEEPVRLMLEALLTDQGHTVTLSPGPEQALQHFDAHRDSVDLLVTDIVMPGMHGPQMAEIMKASRPDLAVLFISGYDPAARERRGAPAPGGAFLQKPFDSATLSLKIREVLGLV